MTEKTPNYLYPLATQRQLQWTKDVVKGEKSAKKSFKPKRFNVTKKQIVQDLVKKKKVVTKFGKKSKTRSTDPVIKKSLLPTDPMRSPDPRPGNAMHITNSEEAYKATGYQSQQN